MPFIRADLAFASDVGQKRSNNEDYIAYFEPTDSESVADDGCLYIVADGVGGGAAGEVASKYAAQKVLFDFYRADDQDLGRRLANSIQSANRDLFEHVEQNPELGRMGTTMVAALLHLDQLTIANVGDSRAYLIRNGAMRQVTRDHSLVAQLVEEGSITPEEAEEHPKRNVVLRSLGIDPVVRSDLFEIDFKPGDSLLLCSDGLTRHVQDDEILETVSSFSADAAVHQLVELANVRGGKDNISVLILHAEEETVEFVPSVISQPSLNEPDFDELLETGPARSREPIEEHSRSTFVRALPFLLLGIVLMAGLAWLLWPLEEVVEPSVPEGVPVGQTAVDSSIATDVTSNEAADVSQSVTSTDALPLTAIFEPLPTDVPVENSQSETEQLLPPIITTTVPITNDVGLSTSRYTVFLDGSEDALSVWLTQTECFPSAVSDSPSSGVPLPEPCLDALSASGDLVVRLDDGKLYVLNLAEGTTESLDEDAGSGEPQSVWTVSFAPDGMTIASGSVDGTFRLWEADSGELLRTLAGHGSSITSAAFAADSQTLAVGLGDGTVQLWDADSGELLRTLRGHGGWVTSVAFDPDGQTIASGSWDRTVRLWDVASGKLQQTLEGHTDWVNSVTFAADGQSLASGSSDDTVRLWDAGSGRLLQTLKGHMSAVTGVAFAPDGETVASGSYDDTVRLWDVASGALQQTLEGHTDKVTSVAFARDGNRLASGSVDDTVRLWDAETGKLLQTLERHTDNVTSVVFAPDGSRLATGSDDGIMRLWDTSRDKLVWQVDGATKSTDCGVGFVASPKGLFKACVSRNRAGANLRIESVEQTNTYLIIQLEGVDIEQLLEWR